MIDFSINYSKKDFKVFLKEFLPNDYEEKNEDLEIEHKNIFFKKAEIIGSVKSLDGLIVVEIERFKAEKSRIKITKELFRFLELHGYKNALIITFSEKEQHYRFSLIKSELVWVTETKVKKNFSNPKRLSFLLGPEAKIHTPSRQLLKLGKIKGFIQN